jgi:hypothetical protein
VEPLAGAASGTGCVGMSDDVAAAAEADAADGRGHLFGDAAAQPAPVHALHRTFTFARRRMRGRLPRPIEPADQPPQGITARSFAREVAEELIAIMIARGIVISPDVPSRLRETEVEKWRDEEGRASACSARTEIETSGESSLLETEMRELVASFRRKAKQSARSALPSEKSKR